MAPVLSLEALRAHGEKHRANVRRRLLIRACRLGSLFGRSAKFEASPDPFEEQYTPWLRDLCRAHTQGAILNDAIRVLYADAFYKAHGRAVAQKLN
jgi:hypothetical protein